MRRIALLITVIFCSAAGFAQVGIGNVVPDTNSILDLRNTNNRGFILPDAPGIMPSSPKGLMYYSQAQNFIYYSDTGGYNALSPWRFKYNGSSSLNTYYNFGGNVGIGLSDPQSTLHLKGNNYLLELEGSSTVGLSFHRTGYSNGRSGHIRQTSSALFIRNFESGKNVTAIVTGGGKFTVSGGGIEAADDINTSSGKIQEDGNDLIPRGTIVMWYGSSSNVPSGWRICNGSGGTPNLTGRFPFGATSAGGTGGSSTHTHPVNPPNTSTTTNGNHRHDVNIPETRCTVSTSRGGSYSLNPQGGSTNIWVNPSSKSSTSDGAHDHDVNIGSFNSGSANHTPPYCKVVFIMKL